MDTGHTRVFDDRIRRAATNTGFASGGVTCKPGALCFYSSSLQVDSLVLETRPNAKPENVTSKPKRRHSKKWKFGNT